MTYFRIVSLYVLSGLLLGVGFLVPILWPLGIVGISLQLYLLQSQTKVQWWGSFIAWTIKFLFVLGFYWSIYPIRWLPFDFGTGELALIALYWVTVSLFLGASGCVFAGLYKVCKGPIFHTTWLAYVLLPFVWVVSEVMGSFLLSIFTLGPGSEPNIYFSLGYVGLLLSHHSLLIHLAKFGGVYALSLVAAVFSVLLTVQLAQKNTTRKLVTVSLFLVLIASTSFTFAPTTPADKYVTVAVVSTSFPIERMFERSDEMKLMQSEALDAAVATQADYILFPEDGRFFDQGDGRKMAMDWFRFRYSSSTAIIIDSGRTEINGDAVLQGFIFDAKTGSSSIVHKKYLVPQGEFVPYIYEHLFRFIGFGQVMEELSRLVSYRIGPNTSQAELPDTYPGLLFCFESASALGVRDLVKERVTVPFIAHPVSHSWFNQPTSFWLQLDQALRVQAIWNNISIVSAGNHAPSKLYLPNGNVTEALWVSNGDYWQVGLLEVPIQ